MDSLSSTYLEATSSPRAEATRLIIRRNEDQDIVASEEVWTRPVLKSISPREPESKGFVKVCKRHMS